jgi:hypothetical protein
MHNVLLEFYFLNILQQKLNMLAADVTKESITFTGQKKYPWSGGYTRSGKDKLKEIS